jgi:hypothetical protein
VAGHKILLLVLLQGIRGSLSGVLEHAKPCLLVFNKVLEDLFATRLQSVQSVHSVVGCS